MTDNNGIYNIVLHYSSVDQALVQEFEYHVIGPLNKLGVITHHLTDLDDPYYYDYLDWPYYSYRLHIKVGVSTLAFLFISPDSYPWSLRRGWLWPYNIERWNLIWEDEVLIIPVLLRPVDKLDKDWFAPCLPRNGKPITSWNNRDAAFQELIPEICQMIKQFTSETSALRNICKSWEAEEGTHSLFLSLATQSQQNHAKKLLKSRRYEEALSAYEEALITDPTNPNLYIGKGEALLRLKRNNEALEAYDIAVRLDPNQSAAHRGRGRAFKQLALQTFEDLQQQAQQCRERAKQLGTEA